MRFEFATASRVIFGASTAKEIAPIVQQFGRRPLIVTGSNPERIAPLKETLAELNVLTFKTEGEPTMQMVIDGVNFARFTMCDVIVGVGGGSVIDTAKAISGLLTNEGDLLDYLEVIGRGQKLSNPATPMIAIPTTAGTGAEVTSNAVIYSPEHRVKVSLRSPLMLPRVAVVDPELTYTSPPQVTATSGMDALTQVIEAFTSNRANPLTDSLCRDGIRRAARSLRKAYSSNDPQAREDMAITSLFSGVALSNAKLGAVHGFAGPMGGLFSAPHGALCAALLPNVTALNIRALRERQSESESLQRYAEIARLITGRDSAAPEDCLSWLTDMAAELDIPRLRELGVQESDFPLIIEKSAVSSSMQGNPIKLTMAEMQEILSLAL
ncbi:MAG: iron-containing alcohol dehydrogenase [Anaerolineae bacterium]|nr:iron-containing alcohol dehydrogenase [Anaerolineae bacterium]